MLPVKNKKKIAQAMNKYHYFQIIYKGPTNHYLRVLNNLSNIKILVEKYMLLYGHQYSRSL